MFNSEFKAKGINFHYAMDTSYDEIEVDTVIADCNRMKQVLVNLITNAIKFTAKKDGKREIEVSVGASVEQPSSYPPNVIFFSKDENAFHIDSTMSSEWGSGSVIYLMVAVKDTGIGISEEGQAKLFERFRYDVSHEDCRRRDADHLLDKPRQKLKRSMEVPAWVSSSRANVWIAFLRKVLRN